ncbi:hypothetical protein QQS21_010292 [Conoideocrella luteorostrata]|uniref:Uncharacterized protein n=1 Tax=Conoideocrella luteorostrata TaxID=1105319 RepID=A0AAJ0CFG1_9HYPO|nr:hypothetical protein QQS21_010292 [Conoideocrella luteorostrata]
MARSWQGHQMRIYTSDAWAPNHVDVEVGSTRERDVCPAFLQLAGAPESEAVESHAYETQRRPPRRVTLVPCREWADLAKRLNKESAYVSGLLNAEVTSSTGARIRGVVEFVAISLVRAIQTSMHEKW